MQRIAAPLLRQPGLAAIPRFLRLQEDHCAFL